MSHNGTKLRIQDAENTRQNQNCENDRLFPERHDSVASEIGESGVRELMESFKRRRASSIRDLESRIASLVGATGCATTAVGGEKGAETPLGEKFLSRSSSIQGVVRRLTHKVSEASLPHGSHLTPIAVDPDHHANEVDPCEYYFADFSHIHCEQFNDNPTLNNVTSSDQQSTSAVSKLQVLPETLDAIAETLPKPSHTPPHHVASTEASQTKRKRVTQPQLLLPMAVDALPELNPAESLEPLQIVRIDSLRPVRVSKNAYGVFCVADCYVLVSCEKRGERNLYTVWMWIGSAAQIDKRFCCALYAVCAKHLFAADGMISRQPQSEETEDFFRLFATNIIYEDETHAAPSGLFKTERIRFPLKVYHIFQDRRLRCLMRLTSIETPQRSFRSTEVYMIDDMYTLVQWNGKKSKAVVQKKCRLIMEVMKNSAGRAGITTISEINEGENESSLNGIQSVQPSHSKGEFTVAALYKIMDLPVNDSYLSDPLIGEVFRRSDITDEDCCIIDAGSEIFLWFGALCSPEKKIRASKEIAMVIQKSTRPDNLSLEKITQFHEPPCFIQYFIDWLEPRVATLAKKTPQIFTPPRVDVAALYRPRTLHGSLNRPEITTLRQMEEINNRISRICGFAFESGNLIALDDAERNGVHKFSQSAYVLICVYGSADGKVLLSTEGDIAQRMCNALLASRYPVVNSIGSLNEREQKSKTSVKCTKDKQRCVVYCWVGRLASAVTVRSFNLYINTVLQDSFRAVYACETEFINVEQDFEPLELLALWGNRSVVHLGSRKTRLNHFTIESGHLYHIRTDSNLRTTRAIEVPCESDRLISRDCFYLHMSGSSKKFSQGRMYLWTGKDSTPEEGRNAKIISEKISKAISAIDPHDFSSKSAAVDSATSVSSIQDPPLNVSTRDGLRVVAENLEPFDFWRMFAEGKKAHFSALRQCRVSGLDDSPRMFICSCEDGYFRVKELAVCAQKYLITSCCTIIDIGRYSPIFLWKGRNASDVVIRMSRRAAEVFLRHCADGREIWNGKLSDGAVVVNGVVAMCEGEEGGEMRSVFHGWV